MSDVLGRDGKVKKTVWGESEVNKWDFLCQIKDCEEMFREIHEADMRRKEGVVISHCDAHI